MEDQRAEEVWFENEWRSRRDPSRYGGCPLKDNVQPMPSVYPDNNFALIIQFMAEAWRKSGQMSFPPPDDPSWNYPSCCGCSAKREQSHKSDCYFYGEEHHMGATIPTCSYHNGGLDVCPCENCNKYISKSDVHKLIKMKADEADK